MENVFSFYRTYQSALILIGISIVSFCVSLFLLFFTREESSFEYIPEHSTKSAERVSKYIKIDIAGAVFSPGVYELIEGSRVGDAIEKAGGLKEEASVAWIEQKMNRAQRLQDGSKVYIPSENDVLSSSHNAENVINTSYNIIDVKEDTININTASQLELETLSGIGPATAKKIIDGRPYLRLEDLVGKKVVGKKVFDSISSKLTL